MSPLLLMLIPLVTFQPGGTKLFRSRVPLVGSQIHAPASLWPTTTPELFSDPEEAVVAPDGKGQVFYSSDETHIRSLALDANGNVLAGTEPSGRVLRIPKAAANRRAFVLYETSKKEITSLLQAANGDLYVAAVGEKTPPAPGQPRPITTDTTTTSNFVISLGPAGNTTCVAAQTQTIPFTPLPTVNSSSVYRIASDGSPEELWSSRDDLVYALGLRPNGKLLLGTSSPVQRTR